MNINMYIIDHGFENDNSPGSESEARGKGQLSSNNFESCHG